MFPPSTGIPVLVLTLLNNVLGILTDGALGKLLDYSGRKIHDMFHDIFVYYSGLGRVQGTKFTR